MELEPGMVGREPMPFGPRVATDHLFERLAGSVADALGGADGAFASVQTTIANNVADGLDDVFTSTIGAAETVAAGHAGAGDDQTAAALVDAGGGVDAQRGASLPYLPQSDAPIEGNFRELPAFGEGHPGNGGISDDDPNKD